MLAALVILVVVLLFVAAFLAPRLSIWPQRRLDEKIESGERKSEEAPAPADDVLGSSLRGVRRTADASASAGRKSRWKLPF